MMTKDDIIELPDERLRQNSKKVSSVSKEVKQLILDMQAATLDWENSRQHELGVALAAVQLGKLLRVIILRNDFENREDQSFRAYINPRITKYGGAVEEDFEGCLSISGIYGKVSRNTAVTVEATDENGQQVSILAEGFVARVFQHEIDHTNGVVFVDHIRDNPEAFYALDSEGHLLNLDYKKDVLSNKALFE